MRAIESHADWLARTEANAARLERSTHYVYSAYDEFGLLLYIGCTSNLAARMSAQRKESSWWQYVARLAVETFDGRTAARTHEDESIRAESPYFNRFPGNQFTETTPRCMGEANYLAARNESAAA